MSTSSDQGPGGARVVLVGIGGVGAPAAIALAHAGLGTLIIVDDDEVETANLHRQILFSDADVGRSKLDAARDALARESPELAVVLYPGRALPSSALAIVREADAVIDATDNFASRFLLADACRLAGVPVVHAAAVRWHGTALSSGPAGRPCYRCLFEDLPEGGGPDCATAGIVGPVAGVIGAVAAEMALAAAAKDPRLSGKVATFDGLRDELRLVDVPARRDCPLCGPQHTIHDLAESRYVGPPSAA
jgi:molybdopterin/thiamine biosynthesis adenylyltransferase